MKIAIVGSRRHPNRQQIVDYVNSLPEDTIIVSGGAKGVDSWAEQAAKARGLKTIIFPAKWKEPCHPECKMIYKNGNLFYPHAGFIRNQYIVDEADKVVAFVMPDRTGGTEDTVKRAEKAGKPLVIFLPE